MEPVKIDRRYTIHIRGRHNLELSGAVPVISRKGRVQEAIPYHLGDAISHALDVRYKVIHDVDQNTYPMRVLGDYVSVLTS